MYYDDLKSSIFKKENLGYKVYQLLSKQDTLSEISGKLLLNSDKLINQPNLNKSIEVGVFLTVYLDYIKRNNKTINLTDIFSDDIELNFTYGECSYICKFKDIITLNDRDLISQFLTAFIESLLLIQPIEETNEVVDFLFMSIPKRIIDKFDNDWFSIANYFDLTGVYKEEYSSEYHLHLTLDQMKIKACVFIFNMFFYDDLVVFFDNFMEEFLNEAEKIDL